MGNIAEVVMNTMSINFFKLSKFLLYLAPFAVVIITPSTLFPFIVGKYIYFKVIIELALIMFVLSWGFKPISNLKSQISNLIKNPLVIAITVFVAIFVLVGFTGINPHASFWSNFERGEGGFLLLHFYAYFLLLLLLFQTAEDWKRLFRVAITAGFFVMLYGVAAAMGISGFMGSRFCERFAGSLGNPAYIGTFSIFVLFYVVYLAVSGNWRGKNWQARNLPILIFLAIYFSAFLLLSQTRGGLLGLGVGIIVALSYLAFTLPSRPWRRVALGVVVAIILLGTLGIYYRQYINLAPWCGGGGNRILDVSFEGETINTRFALWRQSIEAWKERPILGWGPENFSIAFEKYYNPIHTVWFDRAHNIFFDYLVFGGILLLGAFVGVFVIFYWQFFASRKHLNVRAELGVGHSAKLRGDAPQSLIANCQSRLQEALLFALPIAYLVQGLVLFDVLPIYINLFLFSAFASWKLNLKFQDKK